MRKIACVVVLGMAVLGMVGCATTGGGGSGKQAAGAAGGTTQLLHGVSILMPEGWVTDGIAEAGSISQQEVQEGLAKGARFEILNIRKADATGVTSARVVVFLVNSSRDFMPEEMAQQATQQNFTKLEEDTMRVAREVATANKQENKMLEWHVSRQTVDGNLTLYQTGLGKRVGGTTRIMNYDIYLPNAVGVVVNLMGHVEDPGIMNTLDQVAASIRIQK